MLLLSGSIESEIRIKGGTGMSRLIDADELHKVKFHPLPYTHITPTDVDAESYKRGWNDAIDAIMSEAPTIEERKTGKWIRGKCDQCGAHAPFWPMASTYYESDYCPNCGADMRGET